MPLPEQLFQDVRGALRSLSKAKAFTVVASAVLAIGICGVTTQFSMVHAFLFRGLPVDDPQQLVAVAVRDPSWPLEDARPPSRADYVDWDHQQTSFDGLAAYYTNGSFIAVRGGSAERIDGGHVTEKFFSLLRGVTHAALTSRGSVAGAGFIGFEIEGRPTAVGDEPRRARFDTVSDGYFSTLGLRSLAGREFTPEDGGENQPLVVIVNEPFATRYFPNTNPVGQRLSVGQQQNLFPATIIGVVPDTLMQGPVDSEGSDGAGLFAPLAANPPFYVSVVARGHVPPLQLFDPLRRSAAKLNPGLAIYSATTPEQSFERAMLTNRIIAGMFSIFAFVAVVLAGLGLYGMVSLAVTQRVHEFGIRMALGAHAREIMRIVLRQGTLQLALSISVGIAGSLALIQLGGSMFGEFLFQVSPHDPFVFGGVVVILVFATLIACVVPARFAARVDPMIALRAELKPRP